MNLKQVIAIIAIICGVVFHGRLLIGLVNDLPHDHQGFSKFLLPFYAFTTSLSLFGVLGLFDLTKRKRGEILDRNRLFILGNDRQRFSRVDSIRLLFCWRISLRNATLFTSHDQTKCKSKPGHGRNERFYNLRDAIDRSFLNVEIMQLAGIKNTWRSGTP